MKIFKAFLIPCLLLLTTAGAMAQPQTQEMSIIPVSQHKPKTATPQFFRLTFVLKDLEGKKVIDSRFYKTEIAATQLGTRSDGFIVGRDCSIRAGDRVPTTTGPDGQFQYIDVGTNIDCASPALIGHRLAMHVTAVVSSVVKLTGYESPSNASHPAHPLLQNNRWSSEVLIPIGRQTVLFTSEDPTSARNMELDVTATPLN